MTKVARAELRGRLGRLRTAATEARAQATTAEASAQQMERNFLVAEARRALLSYCDAMMAAGRFNKAHGLTGLSAERKVASPVWPIEAERDALTVPVGSVGTLLLGNESPWLERLRAQQLD